MAGWIPKIFGGARTPVGVDVGARSIKAVQLRPLSGGRWAVAASASIPRSAAEDAAVAGAQPAAVTAPLATGEVERLHDVLRRQGFGGSGVVLAIPSSRLLSASLELPPRSSNAPVDSIARAEFARAHKLPLEAPNFEFAHWELPAAARGGRTSQALAVGCTHADADAVLRPFDEDGLDVVALDVEAWALARACGSLAAPPGRVTALLDMGWNACRLVVVHHRTVCYTRLLTDAALRHLHRAVGQHLGLEPEVARHVLEDAALWAAGHGGDAPGDAAGERGGESANESSPAVDVRRIVWAHFDAMIAELRTSFSYAAHQYPDAPLQRLLLTGGGAVIPGAAEYLREALGIEARVARPADVAECPAGFAAAPASMTALGLAMFADADGAAENSGEVRA